MERIMEHSRKILAVTAIACTAFLMSTNLSAKTPKKAADPAATYKSKCASCHGANGSGQTAAGKAMKLKDQRSAEVQGMSDDQLLTLILKGKGKMPGYEKSLGAETCKGLVAYIRKLK